MQKRLQSLFQIAGAMLLILGLSSGSAEARQIDLYASGFSLPIGLEVDADGRVWVADQGAVGEDGSIQVIDLDQTVHPFLTGLRAEPIFGNNEAAQHLRFLNGDLYMTQGLTSDVPEGYLLRISTAGFTPGDMPRSPADLDMVRDVGTFVINEGHAETNAYNLAFGPDDDVFIADASANALLRWRRALDELEIVAEFPPIPNPTGFGPPFSDAVPTGIVYKDGGFYVSVFSGFPFVSGNSRIYRVLPDGTMSIYRDGLTSIVDLAIDPRDEKLVALSFGSATMGDFNPGTGAILKFHDGWHNVLADGLVFPAGLAFADDGTLYFSSLTGNVYRLETNTFEANLAGYNEPAPNPFGSPEDGFFSLTVVTPATGWFEVELDGNNFIMTGEFSGLKAPFTGSHIHTGVAGVNGPVVVPLTPTLDADNRGGTFDQTATVSDDLVAALLAGGLYFNVHSTDHPPGEIRGQLLLQPNSPPEQVEAELASGFAFDFTNEGDPSDPALQLFWDAVTDPDGDRVIYQVEAAADPDFDMLVMGILTVLEGVVFTEIGIDRGSLDAVLEQLGVAVGGTFTFYVRVNSSDGSLRTVGETMIFNVTRGILRDPDDDVTAPSCRLIAMLPGPPAALHVEVQDEESGLAAIEVVFANNVDIDIPTFDVGTNDVLTIIATKIDNAMRASFAIRATDVAGNETVCDPVVATLIAEIPEHFELKQNYPNPFNPSTSFELLLPESGHVSLAVYDLGGRRVATLVEQHMDAGTYRFDWDGMTDGGVALASGVYIYRVIAGANVSTRTMTLIR